MKKFVCTVCGYVHEGDAPPAQCPICKAPAEKFTEQTGDLVFADEHRIGVAKDVDPRIIEGLRMNFTGECSEVGICQVRRAFGRSPHGQHREESEDARRCRAWRLRR